MSLGKRDEQKAATAGAKNPKKKLTRDEEEEEYEAADETGDEELGEEEQDDEGEEELSGEEELEDGDEGEEGSQDFDLEGFKSFLKDNLAKEIEIDSKDEDPKAKKQMIQKKIILEKLSSID